MITLSDAISKRISNIMKQRNIKSYNKLSVMTGVPKTTLTEFMSNEKTQYPKLPTIQLLCDGLGITVREFFDDPLFDETYYILED